MRDIDLIVIHCFDTTNGKHFTVEDVDSWHGERGFLRNETHRLAFQPELHHIGYHYVIYIDGTVHAGRSEAEVGAHAYGYNSKSIGISMAGKDKFTPAQWTALENLLKAKMVDYPKARIRGHYQVNSEGKTCPNFDVSAYLVNAMRANEKNIL